MNFDTIILFLVISICSQNSPCALKEYLRMNFNLDYMNNLLEPEVHGLPTPYFFPYLFSGTILSGFKG